MTGILSKLLMSIIISKAWYGACLNQNRTVNGLDWNIMESVWFTADATADSKKTRLRIQTKGGLPY